MKLFSYFRNMFEPFCSDPFCFRRRNKPNFTPVLIRVPRGFLWVFNVVVNRIRLKYNPIFPIWVSCLYKVSYIKSLSHEFIITQQRAIFKEITEFLHILILFFCGTWSYQIVHLTTLFHNSCDLAICR